jgi:Mg-chelatase subunit ChlD
MTFTPGFSKNPNAAKADAIKAARAQAAQAPKAEDGALQKWISPADAKERIRIIFDDSGSMSEQIENAKEGVIEFYRNCIPNQTAVAVQMLDAKHPEIEALNTNLIEAATLLKQAAPGLGGTPLFSTSMAAFALSPKPTRMVIFTDGEAGDSLASEEMIELEDGPMSAYQKRSANVLIARARELSCPIDTVFFGPEQYHEQSIALLKYLAERTGGYFLHFDPSKVNFKTAFKYLAPVNRLMLASESVRKEIESGQRS